MKTVSFTTTEEERKWHLVDANGKVLGRMAAKVAAILRGKHKPIFTTNQDVGDHVVVINASHIVLTGQKLTQKMYRHHTGYPGGLKEISAGKRLLKKPDEMVSDAITGMLPKTKLGNAMAKKLRVYAGASHPHQSQKLEPLKI